MPGILPMKVIKVGTSSQSRIAQACDRCRSKKIRCDGIRPTCTQCSSVGFECKTSDKLSRRAFPRGYTESLEERVRVLEAEVRDLKDLLDEKDEKIEMLSKMHANNRTRLSVEPASGVPSAMSSPPLCVRAGKEPTPPKEDTFRVQASPLLLGVENSDSYYMGPSSGRSFIESFKRRLQETGRSCSDFNIEAFPHVQGLSPLVNKQTNGIAKIPPRMFSDRCVNIYFQEWAPLFPVLHKPTFLRTYEDWVAEPEKVKSHHKLAQLNLVFAVAALSSENPDLEHVASCEHQWQRSLQAIAMDDTMETLQCLILALTYCQIRADNKRLQHYKCLAVGLSHRLGLHQSQKRFSFGALTIETRKKVFWTLYTLDCFSAATLGLPKLIKEEDVHTEYPNDIDDEYVTEKGFLPTLPGESTRLSGALAFFRASRILAKVLEKNYPAATSHELSLQQMSALEAQLEEWSGNLPQHLKLTFKQDKPSTDVTGSRSPLLAVAYYFIRTLIYRPAIGSSLGPKAAPAVISVSESSKHTIQIIQLLEERSMSFSFCLNKTDLLVLCGMTLLYQSLDLKRDSMMLKDIEKLVNAVIKIVGRTKVHDTYEFERIASLVILIDKPQQTSLPTPPGQSPNTSMAAPPHKSPTSKPKKKQQQQQQQQPQQQQPSPSASHQALGQHASVSDTDLLMQQQQQQQQQAKLKRLSVPNMAQPDLQRQRSARGSLDSGRPNLVPKTQHRSQRHSMSQAGMVARVSPPLAQRPSLDYITAAAISNGTAGTTGTGQITTSPTLAAGQNSQHGQPQPHHQHRHDAAAVSPVDGTQPFYSPVVQMPHHKDSTGGMSASEWESLLGQIDAGGQANLYDAIYGGPQVAMDGNTAANASPTVTTSAAPATTAAVVETSGSNWSPGTLDLSTFHLGDFVGGSSLSEESLSSASGGDDLSSLDFRDFSVGSGAGLMAGDGFILDGMARDGSYGL